MLCRLLVVVHFPVAVEQAKHGRGIHLHDQGPRPETGLANGIEGSDGQKQAPRPVAERMTMMCLNFIP